jgi:hypothetical protein
VAEAPGRQLRARFCAVVSHRELVSGLCGLGLGPPFTARIYLRELLSGEAGHAKAAVVCGDYFAAAKSRVEMPKRRSHHCKLFCEIATGNEKRPMSKEWCDRRLLSYIAFDDIEATSAGQVRRQEMWTTDLELDCSSACGAHVGLGPGVSVTCKSDADW